MRAGLKDELESLLAALQAALDRLDPPPKKARVHLVRPPDDDLFYTREAEIVRTAGMQELEAERKALTEMIAKFDRISRMKLAKLKHDLDKQQ